MKKIIATLALAVTAASFATALDMSAGGGVTFSGVSTKTKTEIGSVKDDNKATQTNLGVKGFFDATYAVAEVGYAFDLTNKKDGKDTKIDSTNLTLGVLGKYPIAVGSVTLFPLAGAEYDLNMSYKYDGKDAKKDLTSDAKSSLNQIWIKAGIGADVAINDKLYLRPTALAGYKLHSKAENDTIDLFDKINAKATINTFKYDIGLAVGYKF